MSVIWVTKSDERYEALSQGFNQRWVAKPDAIAFVSSTEDVVHAVDKAVGNNQRISVRSGGHCYENFVCNADVKVIIDVSGLDQVTWDEQRQAYCLGAGVTNWRLCTHLYRLFGVAVPGGSCYSVAAGGHISAGGFGLLSRQFGLTVDYLQAVEVVVVGKKGKAKPVIADRNDTNSNRRELWWAHTGGGGGNFGVITRYWMSDLKPPPKNVLLSGAQFKWSKLKEQGFKRLVANFGTFFAHHGAPDDRYADLFAILKLTHISNEELGLIVQLDATDSDSQSKLDEFYKAVLAEIPADIADFTMQVGEHAPIQPLTPQGRVMPWIQATQTLNSSGENRRAKYKSAYHRTAFTPQHIDAFYRHLSDTSYDNNEALLQIDSYGCKINKPGRDTAVAQRDSVLKLQYQTYWTDPTQDDKHLTWIRTFYADVYTNTGGVPIPYVGGGPMPLYVDTDGCFVGYPDVDLNDTALNRSGIPWSELYYKEHYPRLQQVKALWDPTDVFHHAQSIQLPVSTDRD